MLPAAALQHKHGEMVDKKTPLMKLWLQSHGRRRVQKLGFYPNGLLSDKSCIVINTFVGLPVQPMACDETEVVEMLDIIYKHLYEILADSDDASFRLQRRVVAHILFRGTKLRLMLSIYSHVQQCGKGSFYDDFLSCLLGKYFLKPAADVNSENGLFGRFNWTYRDRLLVLLDENVTMTAPSVLNKMKRWLCQVETQWRSRNSE